jgi:hypothetical protein
MIIGSLIGIISGTAIFFNLDTTKGWNPYGWWYSAVFLATVICGLAGVIIGGLFCKSRE